MKQNNQHLIPHPSLDRKIAESEKEINGWGVDADPENDPTYPMKNRTGADYQRLQYERPEQQVQDVEVLKSVERPSLSRVFGTSTPPSGLSGIIRRFAFKYSESTYAHWVPLVIADRINVVEGIIDDLKHGHLPNIFAEKGWNAEWKYNRKAVQKQMVVGAVLAIGVIALMIASKKKKKHSFS